MPRTPDSDRSPQSRRSSRSTYLMVEDGLSSRVVRLDAQGSWILGTGQHADISLSGEHMAQAHALVELRNGQGHIAPLDDRHPVFVNEQKVDNRQPLRAGDVIGLGETRVTFHGPRTTSPERRTLPYEQFRQRLDEELERSLRYGHPFVLMALRPDDMTDSAKDSFVQAILATVRTVDIVGLGRNSELFVLFPETHARNAEIPVQRVLTAVASGSSVGAGVALCPNDSVDPQALIEGATLAASHASPGAYRTVEDVVSRWTIADMEVLALDPLMKKIMALVERVATSDIPVLIVGETGTGKEVIAQAVHGWSRRAHRRMLSINCASVPETLIESELFGHERGAFSGAVNTKKGLFEQADGATIFLDEIGELAPKSQAEFLRVLETKTFTRVGSLRERTTDVRIIAATNRPLEDEIAAGRFRQDLYFRLNTANIPLPPLRDRPLDIPVLARHFLASACEREKRTLMRLSSDAIRHLALHTWPGNIRELENVIQRAVILCKEETLMPEVLPPAFKNLTGDTPQGTVDGLVGLSIKEVERELILRTLEQTGHNITRTAEILGITRRGLQYKLHELGL